MRFVVAYYRVSTPRQGRSHLGLEAQQAAVKSYCTANEYSLLSEIEEVKSTRKHRPGLLEALLLCRKQKAIFIVARLDRLGRDVEQIARIVKSDVEIIIVDNPHANRFTLHILAAVAEEQRRSSSENTKGALQVAKAKGKKLGINGKELAKRNKQEAEAFAQKMLPVINLLASEGYTTVRALERELNTRKTPTFRAGGQWHKASVYNLLQRLKTINSTLTLK